MKLQPSWLCRLGILLIALIALVCIMVACNDDTTPVETDSETLTTTATAPHDATTAPEDSGTAPEDVTTAPETTVPEVLAPGEPTVSGTLSESYHVDPTEKSGSTTISGTNISINYDSIFYGTESAVDRNTCHWGNLLCFDTRVTSRNTLIMSGDTLLPLAIGDFTGDRKGEFVVTEGDALTIVGMDEKSTPKVALYKQTFGVNVTVCGTGRFNDDFYTDILLYTEGGNVVVGYGNDSGFDWKMLGALPDRQPLAEGEQLFAGDVDGDRVTDLVVINDLTVTSYMIEDGTIVRYATSTLPLAEPGQFLCYNVGDYNSDKVADVMCTMRVEDVEGDENHAIRTYFGRRDGHFGPYASEGENKNLYPTWSNTGSASCYRTLACGDLDGDGVNDVLSLIYKPASDKTALLIGTYPKEAPAYDYSAHVIKTDDGYILYSGGLYEDFNTDKYPASPGDHLLAYTSDNGLFWYQNLDGATFLLGGECGVTEYSWGDKIEGTNFGIPGTGSVFGENWWIGNTMEPEVVRDPETGIYYMYWQVENYCPLDSTHPYWQNQENPFPWSGADRIGVSISYDGIHFERKIDSPAIITSDIYSCFTHQEVIYVPDDPDGKCWWMYVRYVHKNGIPEIGGFEQRIRIRSADPTCFDMDKEGYDVVNNWGALGTQLGYVSNYDGNGNKLFVHLAVTNVDGINYNGDPDAHNVATLFFSTDGVNWVDSDIRMAGADMLIEDEYSRRNAFFAGMSTYYGTGEICKNENGEYEIVYVTTSCVSPVAPGIFQSELGVGIMTFTLNINS